MNLLRHSQKLIYMILDKFKNFFLKNGNKLKIGSFGMINNPIYREEPWRENIRSRLDFFDVVCLMCGYEPDIKMLAKAFPEEWKSGKLKAKYKPCPFPEWSYEELPKHLNEALDFVREQNCDWAVKLDIDTVFHEKDLDDFLNVIQKAHKKGKWLVSFSKLQFFLLNRYWIKSSIPIAIRMSAPIVYGRDQITYTDLCQPIIQDLSSKFSVNGRIYDIPSGIAVSDDKIYKVRRINLYNYDYTYRTYDRSVELLYQIEMAHARFWGKGYSGLSIDKITRESSMQDFLESSSQRYSRMNKKMKIKDHPKYFQESLQNLNSSQWGHNLWDKIDVN